MTQDQEHAALFFVYTILAVGLVAACIYFPIVYTALQMMVALAAVLVVLGLVAYTLYGGFCLLRSIVRAIFWRTR